MERDLWLECVVGEQEPSSWEEGIEKGKLLFTIHL